MGRFAHALARATATAVVVLFTGCDAADSVGPSARDAEDSPPALEARVDTMARLLATSMSREDVRQAVLAALRESPWVEHKIRLSDLFAGDDGRALLHTIAAQEGMTAEALSARVALLPPLDLYIPSTASRRSWRGGPDIAVVSAAREDRTMLTAYDIAGGSRQVRSGERVTFATPVMLFLTTPEPRLARFGVNHAMVSARTVEGDAPVDDGTSATWGGGAVLHLASGERRGS